VCMCIHMSVGGWVDVNMRACTHTCVGG
jgi:hypothetical protein